MLDPKIAITEQQKIDHPWYQFIDEDIEVITLAKVGFTNLLAKQPYQMDDKTVLGKSATKNNPGTRKKEDVTYVLDESPQERKRPSG